MARTTLAQFSLRIRKGVTAPDVEALVVAVFAWEPALAPINVNREAAGVPRANVPYEAQQLKTLAQACARMEKVSYTFGTRGSDADTTVRTGFDQVAVDVLLPFAGDAAKRLEALISGVPQGAAPAMAFVIDRNKDEPMRLDGLHAVTGMPPVLFLDGAAVARVGAARVQSAPCQVKALPQGYLLSVEPDLAKSSSAAAIAERQKVQQHLGLWPWGQLQ